MDEELEKILKGLHDNWASQQEIDKAISDYESKKKATNVSVAPTPQPTSFFGEVKKGVQNVVENATKVQPQVVVAPSPTTHSVVGEGTVLAPKSSIFDAIVGS